MPLLNVSSKVSQPTTGTKLLPCNDGIGRLPHPHCFRPQFFLTKPEGASMNKSQVKMLFDSCH